MYIVYIYIYIRIYSKLVSCSPHLNGNWQPGIPCCMGRVGQTSVDTQKKMLQNFLICLNLKDRITKMIKHGNLWATIPHELTMIDWGVFCFASHVVVLDHHHHHKIHHHHQLQHNNNNNNNNNNNHHNHNNKKKKKKATGKATRTTNTTTTNKEQK